MKESNFQLVGKPTVNSILYETNKNFEFNDELSLEVTNEIHVIKGINEHLQEANVVYKIGIFTSQEFEKVPFKISMEIEGHFKWDEELEKNEVLLENMLKQNAPAILYSYVRPLITLITIEANMPPLVIPLMNFK
ncbi:MAG: protein-export chaperone SecB [Carboxydocellales bacterium]